MLEDMNSVDELRLSQESFSEYFSNSQKSNDIYNDIKEILKDVTNGDSNAMPENVLFNVETCSSLNVAPSYNLNADDSIDLENHFTVDYISSTDEPCNLVDNFPGIESFDRPPETSDECVVPGVIKSQPLTFPPPLINWSGNFGFNVHLESVGSVKKNTWIYSADRDKLYVAKDKPCVINFITHGSVPEGTKIRALGLYSLSKHSADIVHRCDNHMYEDKNAGVLNPEHLIRCESNQAVYEKDEASQILSVVVPYEMPQGGHSYSTYLYKFVCFGSCPKINRRPIKIVFLLEWENNIIGQRCVDVKICASPYRDSRNDDKQGSVRNTQPEEEGCAQKKKRRTGASENNNSESVACTSASTIITTTSEETSATSAPIYSPATDNWEGEYKFSFRIQCSETVIYSETRNKLYAVKDYPCNITFKTEYLVPGDTNIRITPVYALPEHASHPVWPCSYNTALGIDKDHIIRCLNVAEAIYDVNPFTLCRSVIVPFTKNSSGCISMGYCFSFRCYGPCKNCIERLPIKFIFTLENRNHLLGQYYVDVKLCEFPLRDCKNDDDIAAQELTKRNELVVNPSSVFKTFDVMNTSNLDEDQQKPYVIQVHNENMYNYLTGLKQLFEIASCTSSLTGTHGREATSSDDGT